MFKSILSDLLNHAHAEQPNECCGLVVQNGDVLTYAPCRNSDAFPQNQFTIHPDDWATIEDSGNIVAVCHSHVNQSAQPSDADKLGCERSGLPWLIVSVPSGDAVTIEPCGFTPKLIGREFVWGVFDCFTLVRDYYRDELAIELPPNQPYEWNFWKKGLDLYSCFEQFDFVEVTLNTEPQVHDIFLIQINSTVANHAAIYLGDGEILHHLEKQLSRRDVYGGFWQKHTRFVVRHQSLC